MEIFCNVLLVLYYIFSFSQTIPCVVKLVKTKKSRDYSLLNRLCQYIALLLLTAYVCFTKNWDDCGDVITISLGFVDVALLTLENALILHYYKR